MLTSLVRIPTDPSSIEDIFSSALGIIFTDDLSNQHGEPGSTIVYQSKQFGDIELRLANPDSEDGRKLFAHYLWNAGVLMGELIGSATAEDIGSFIGTSNKKKSDWAVKEKKVLELGAGTGLSGIVSILAGAEEVVLSDYPEPTILANLSVNVEKNVPSEMRSKVTVQGHEWGVLTDHFSQTHARKFTRILAADCLWMPWQHKNLARSMLHFLSNEEDAKVWIIAGFHTGRAKLAPFFDVAAEEGLEIDTIWEQDANAEERQWQKERDGGREDISGRKKWLVVAILQRRQVLASSTAVQEE